MKFLKSKVGITLSLIIAGNLIVESFIDDDDDYYNNESLIIGWGWLGINSANAAMSCSSGDTGTHCVVVVDPCDIYNCNETNEPRDTYTPPQTDYYDGGPGYGMEPYPTEQTNIIDKNNDRINDCWKGLYSTNATGANLSSDWGWRVINGNPDFHPGWDIGTAGQQGVNALFMGDAKVIAKGNDIYNGYWLSYELITDGTFVKYIHLDNLPSVSIDGVYSMGDVAGKIGKTGSTSQIHLHMAMYPSRQGKITNI